MKAVLRPHGGELRSGRGVTKLTKAYTAATDGASFSSAKWEAGRVEERLLAIPVFLLLIEIMSLHC